jgi:hypothetical protein
MDDMSKGKPSHSSSPKKYTNTINMINMIDIARVAAASVALESEGPAQSFFFCRLEG